MHQANVVLGYTLTALITLGGGFAAADDSTLTPIDQVPKLPETFDFADYKQIFSGGTLLPDRICWDTVTVAVGSPEAKVKNCAPDSDQVITTTERRTREQQWQFLRAMLAQNNTSMHYYNLVGAYYYEQLSGWFRTYEWRVFDVGTIRVHLHAAKETGEFRVWLLQLAVDQVTSERVVYKEPPGLVLVRLGEPPMEWDINSNRVRIGPKE